MQRIIFAAAVAVAALSSSAHAHITISSGPGFANKSGKITFAINHGCTGADTVKIVVDMPAGITGVRAMPSDFGTAKLTRDPANTDVNTNVTNVTWEKPDALDSDDGFYELTIRAKVPNTPFTRLQFNIHQTCRSSTGTVTVVDWIQPPGAQSGEPAPLLPIVPPRLPGWNKVVLGAALLNADLPTYFGDALIVWRGSEGFSTNANTMAQINATTGVSVLAADLASGDEIWVRY